MLPEHLIGAQTEIIQRSVPLSDAEMDPSKEIYKWKTIYLDVVIILIVYTHGTEIK